jgi:protein-L-isoaspartate(D-aspartate) O-methyltransferase
MSSADERVSRALDAVPRELFLPAHLRSQAPRDAPLPIGHGQTNSQPFTVASMLTLLDVQPGQRVLDLGAGSGWTTALLAHLVGTGGTVIGVERVPELIGPARRALAAALEEAAAGPDASAGPGEARIQAAQPGVLGAPQLAPFDRILVSAEATSLPGALVEQLGEGGVMVIPVGTTMQRVTRHGQDHAITEHGAFRFVPLIED